MFEKILIANRGEIAVRIIRTCHSLGVQVVAIFAEDDRHSLHVKLADEAHLLPGSSLAETYLNIPGILEIAKRSGAQAIHPGYGFLSENPDFADACVQEEVVFIGPSGDVMRKMGSKVAARQYMQQAGVPITPGSPPLNSLAEAQDWAQKITYPILLKASAGGGGRGMKMVHSDDELPAAFEAAKRESKAYFSDDTVYMEKLVYHPRHIEVQIVGDSQGQVIHLGERDCSVQRRNQKLIEETPAPHLPPEVRQKLLEAAVKGAQALNYTGAGTFEFVVQDNRDVYFMEVNTRLQVEHPITEMVTGVDLVREQLRIAAGMPLSYSQDEISFSGHAVECRITVEDAGQNFRPVPGDITTLNLPSGPWVRLDGMLQAQYEIPRSYDSLVAKLVCWGRDREQALSRLKQALSEFEIGNVTSLIPFYQWVLTIPDFQAGQYTTGFIPTHFSTELFAPSPFPELASETATTQRQEIEVEVNGKLFHVALHLPEGFAAATPGTHRQKPTRKAQDKRQKSGGNPNQIVCPMAGTVVKVAAQVGQTLEAGQVAFVVESMKMENDIVSPRQGKIKSIAVQAGEKVQTNALLLEFET